MLYLNKRDMKLILDNLKPFLDPTLWNKLQALTQKHFEKETQNGRTEEGTHLHNLGENI